MGIVHPDNDDEEDEEPRGVILDLDHAIYVDKQEGRPVPGHIQSSQDRTGTIPFKALDLHCPLNRGVSDQYPNYHLPRYDLEAFIWVFIWLLYETPKDLPVDSKFTSIMEQWNSSNVDDIRRSKESLIMNFETHQSCSKIRRDLDSLVPLMDQLLAVLRISLFYSDPTNPVAEAERSQWPGGRTQWYHTLGGRFTVEGILEILQSFQNKVTVGHFLS